MIPLLCCGWVTVWSAPGPQSAPAIDLRAAGDVMLARFMGRVAERKGGDFLFAGVKALIDGGDVSIANLESPLTKKEIARRGPFRFTADPELAFAIARAGFEAVSIGNNHALDAGEAGVADTIAALERAYLAPLTFAPRVLEVRGVRLAIAGFDLVESARVPSFAAEAEHKIAFVHWGREYEPTTARQRELAERLIAEGADLVIGSHPHVMQPVQEISAGRRHGVVAYSLGNLVFDQPHRGLIMRAMIGARGVERVDLAIVDHLRGVPMIASLAVWSFDGARFAPQPIAPAAIAKLTKTAIDLRGDGKPLSAALVNGVVTIRDRERVVWKNESPSWRVLTMEPGDPDNDGRLELMLLVKKEDGTHPFIVGERGGRVRVIWGGSATTRSIRDFALGDFDGDRREELAVLDGEGELSIWRWYGWGFEEIARSAVSRFERVAAQDLDRDGRAELVLQSGGNSE